MLKPFGDSRSSGDLERYELPILSKYGCTRVREFARSVVEEWRLFISSGENLVVFVSKLPDATSLEIRDTMVLSKRWYFSESNKSSVSTDTVTCSDPPRSKEFRVWAGDLDLDMASMALEDPLMQISEEDSPCSLLPLFSRS
jgi:hypothetical protein